MTRSKLRKLEITESFFRVFSWFHFSKKKKHFRYSVFDILYVFMHRFCIVFKVLWQNYKMIKILHCRNTVISYTLFFLWATVLEATPSWNWQKKIIQKLTETLRLNFCYLKIVHFFHPRYHPKVVLKKF